MLSVTLSVETALLLVLRRIPRLFTMHPCTDRHEGRPVGRYRERQYQLAAQKNNAAVLKYDYYQQIANYFERECRIAKHYDSWNYRNIDPKGELQRAKKAEKLLTRRNKLRSLLAEEDEAYIKELEERKKLKSRQEDSSLEILREKLKERRAEQSLYYPKTCRRYQSYFVCPKETNISPRWNTLKDTNLQYPRVCRGSTNSLRQNEQNSYRKGSKMSDEIHKLSQELEKLDTSPSSEYENGRPTSKYSARYARRSLENTNVRVQDSESYPASRTPSRSSISFGSSNERYLPSNGQVALCGDNKENASRDTRSSNPQANRVTERRSSNSSDGPPIHSKNASPREDVPHQRNADSSNLERSSMDHIDEGTSSYRAENLFDKCGAKDYESTATKDTRQFEVEKSLPWLRINPGDKNLSKQMFLYLTHKELKCKIDDLSKRELHACNKQCWDEALRLRDMRNKVELNREKKLYNMDDLDLDDESRKLGLVNIDKRELELLEREQVCMDSTMYSQDAKDLWKKWVCEDEKCAIMDAREQREKLMNSLEKEWQGLAIRDKERISRSYQHVMSDSALQEEHKLSAAINASRMKSFSNSSS